MKLFWKFFAFCLVGGSGALIELAFFNLLYYASSNFPISKFVGLIISVTFVFFTNRNFTFRARNGRISKQAIRYIVLYSFAIVFNYGVSLIVSSILGPGTLYGNIATVSGIIAAIPVTFLGSLFWVFKDKNLF